ncbi:radical SAM protein [Candidatus Woesebacteria bacterium]|nr:radical SAM protein [Candidatus Woesebacteria bacterium]QQG47907.1 MAG: radical SAM protein [Candidatus Woesebacteria bacterium]
MKSFRLKDGVFFVKGALNGALLDTTTGNVYSINQIAVSIITKEKENQEYWEKLIQMKLAEECSVASSLPDIPRMSSISLKFVWFEIISNDCNESCIHCYAESMPPSHRKALGLVDISGENKTKLKLTYADWVKYIQEAYDLGCRRCQFIGGEPFVYKEGDKTVLDLASFAKEIGYEFVEIFTNATLLTHEKIDRIKRLNLNVAVSLYSHDPQIHDSITQTPGSHSRTVQNLKSLKLAGVKTRVEIVIMKQNQNTIEETQILIKDIGFSGKHPDPIRPKGRGDNLSIRPDPEKTVEYGYMTKPNFTANKNTIAHYSKGHSCLAGKITLTDSGDILPCIFSRNHIIGNVLKVASLESILLSEAMQQVWNTTKDSVLVCRDCEYRYVCFDCRPLSEAAASGNSDYMHAPYPRCTHNPYTGEWAKGTWRVNEKGEPWYDRSIEPIINMVIEKRGFKSTQPSGH